MNWNWKSYTLSFLLAILIFGITNYYDVNKILSFVIVFIVVLLATSSNLYAMIGSSNVEKIEKLLIANRKNPYYNLIIALAEDNTEQIKSSINTLLIKYKSKTKQALYKTILALHKKEIQTAKEHIKYIRPLPYQYYYQGYVYIEEGNYAEASKMVELIPQKWMKLALLSEIKFRSNEYREALDLAHQAYQHSRGIQKYSIYKTFQRQFPEFEVQQ